MSNLKIIQTKFKKPDVTIINRTSHTVNLYDHITNKLIKSYKKNGIELRFYQDRRIIGNINGVSLYSIQNIKLNQKVPVTENIYHIVSPHIKNAFPWRDDFIIPIFLKKNKNGLIIGCTAFGGTKQEIIYL